MQQKVSDRSSTPQKYNRMILYALFVEIILIIAFFHNHGWAPKPLAEAPMQNSGSYIAALDPMLHRPTPALSVLDSQGHTMNLAAAFPKPQVLIFFSGCQPCSLSYMITAQQFQKEHPNFSFRSLVIASAADSAVFSRKNNLHLDFYTENDLTTQRQYNVQWHPRVFVLDRQGLLTYAQPYNTPFGSALMQAVASIKP